MTNLLQQGTAWLAEQRATHLATPVTYQRGAESVAVTATVGQTVFRTDNALASGIGGAIVRFVSRDFLIRVDDLVLGGTPVQPQRGDRVIEVSDGRLYTHEVMPFDATSDAWRFSDPQRTTYRIHTKLIEESSP